MSNNYFAFIIWGQVIDALARFIIPISLCLFSFLKDVFFAVHTLNKGEGMSPPPGYDW